MLPRRSEEFATSPVIESLPEYTSDDESFPVSLLQAYDRKELSTIEEFDETAPGHGSSSLRTWLRKSFFITINVAASVGIIFYNKHALNDEQLKGMPITVVAVHSFATAGVLWLASRKPISLFHPVSTPIRSLLTLSMAFPIYVVLGLLSVSRNPVGIYQLGKVMNSPVVVLLNFLFFSTAVSRSTLYSIVLMCSGVAATIHAGWEQTSVIGLTLVVTSTCAAALYQIGIGIKHKSLGLSSPQLVYQQSRLSGLLLLFVIPFLDNFVSPTKLSWAAISGLIGTGILASIVNLSQFLVIESTSALTFNVASQLKTCLVLIIAWLIADKPPTMTDYVGVSVTMIGSALYAYIALSERKKASAVLPLKSQ